MTIYKSVNRTLTIPGPSFAAIAAGLGGGRLAGFCDSYAIPAAGFLAGDGIEFGEPNTLKKGDTFMGYELWHEAMGAGVLAAIGDDGVGARYGSAHDVAAAATTAKLPNVFAGVAYQLTQDRPLIVTLSGAAPTAAKIIRLAWYVLRS